MKRYTFQEIEAAKLRAGRALLRWTQADLARKSGISEITIKKIEACNSDPRSGTLHKIQTALESGGIGFEEFGVFIRTKHPIN